MPSAADHEQVLGDLLTASHTITLEELPDVVAEHVPRAGWPEVLIYVADLQQTVLSLLAPRTGDASRRARGYPSALRVDDSVAGRAFQLGRIVADPDEAAGGQQPRHRWWVPLLEGTERLGVARVAADADIGDDAGAVKRLRGLAALLALLLASKRSASDSYARLVRRRGMNVAAEMAWRLMPQHTLTTGRVLISALMEPAYEVSGDAFDYGVAGEVVHLSLFDAMGHDTAAGLTATLALAAARNHRRHQSGILEAAEAIEAALVEQFDGARYATGVLAELNARTGEFSWTNLGHLPPVVLRQGDTAFLHCPPAPPMGTGLGLSATLCQTRLQPGDRLLLYTDGVTEARNRRGEEFGLARVTDFVARHQTASLPAPETLRRLILLHRRHHEGRLNDDATVLLLEWNGPTPYRSEDVETLLGLPDDTAHADSPREAGQAPDADGMA
ncbi:PP2C family protein-serine/threonine phosphatase [Streptomyces sp. TS71-3]|uniref:PP2C family protein-serine/threonine phosphatase n=1 Tax=Streptomyces sp. TS71-3 TaxID=2733862 RepID=UPI001BB32D8F|nr:PP2C family protein-serine/threonine phosphatase [Streptomyces sp. TS71-3]